MSGEADFKPEPIYSSAAVFEAARAADMLPPQPVTSVSLEFESGEFATLVIRTPIYKNDLKKFVEAL